MFKITINKSIQRVRKIIKLAIAEGYLQKNPFILYKPKRYETKVVFLTNEELKALEDFQQNINVITYQLGQLALRKLNLEKEEEGVQLN